MRSKTVFRDASECLAFPLLAAASVLLVPGEPFVLRRSDTEALLAQVDAGLACAQAPCPAAGQFPLLSWTTTAGLRLVGVDDGGIYRFWSYASLAALALILFVGARALRARGRADRVPIWRALLLASPLLPYARMTFGEPLSAALTLLAVAARSRSARAVAAFLAAAAKETAAPPLALLLGAAWLAERPRRTFPVLELAGAAAGLAAGAAFNVWRFGGPFNLVYLRPEFQVPTLALSAEFFVAQLLSPASGLLLVWPAFVALALTHLGRGGPSGGWVKAAWALAWLAPALALSRWFSPFGWIAWGPRLWLPWLPALAWLALATSRFRVPDLRPRAAIVAATAFALLHLLNWGVTVRSSAIHALFLPDDACPRPAIIEQGAEYFYACVRHQIWERGGVHWVELARTAAAYPVAVAAGFAAFFALGYQALRGRRESISSSDAL